MAKGGRESLRPSYGRPKLTLVSKKEKKLGGGVTKKVTASREISMPNPPERTFEM